MTSVICTIEEHVFNETFRKGNRIFGTRDRPSVAKRIATLERTLRREEKYRRNVGRGTTKAGTPHLLCKFPRVDSVY